MSDLNVIVGGRAPLHPDIDEPGIEKLVHAFYAKIRRHDVLGPIFLKVIGEDWGPHLVRMCDFWSSVTMMSGRYKGTPMVVHQRIAGLEHDHFQLWLALWRETAQECCSPEIAAIFIDRAERIARSLQLALFYRPEDDAPARAQ